MTITKLKVRIYGDPCLRKKSSTVKEVGPAERMIIHFMIETMREHKGIGLAAPQVGINQRIFVADVGQGPMAIINPRILKRKGSAVLEEGCLSIPGVTVEIKRPQEIVLRYLNENNETVEKTYSDLMARVVLHETDHLNGKLIIDYVSFAQKRKLRKKLKEIQSSEEES